MVLSASYYRLFSQFFCVLFLVERIRRTSLNCCFFAQRTSLFLIWGWRWSLVCIGSEAINDEVVVNQWRNRVCSSSSAGYSNRLGVLVSRRCHRTHTLSTTHTHVPLHCALIRSLWVDFASNSISWFTSVRVEHVTLLLDGSVILTFRYSDYKRGAYSIYFTYDYENSE